MTVKLTLCDSGGAAGTEGSDGKKIGVTTNAYNFWRKMRDEGLASRFHLLKGDSTPGAPRARITYPDSAIARDKSRRRGENPVLQLNPTLTKDNLEAERKSARTG